MGKRSKQTRSRQKRYAKWRLVAGVIAAVVIFGLTAVYWMLAGLDVNRFKPEIVAAVKTATGRKLTVGGDIGLRIGLRPTLVVDDVRFQNASWGSRRDMLRLKRLELQIAAWPLLLGTFDLKRVVFVAPDLLLETDARGRWNLPRVRTGDGRQQPDSDRQAGVLRHLTFADVRIENGRLAWRRARFGKTATLVLKDIRAVMSDIGGPLRLEISAGHKNRVLKVSGSIGRLSRLIAGKRPWPIHLSLKYRGLQAEVSGSIGNAAAARGQDLAFRARGDSLAEIKTIIPYWPLSLGEAFSLDFHLSTPEKGKLRFSDLSFSAGKSDLGGRVEIGFNGPRPRLDADLRSKRIVLQPSPKQPGDGGATRKGRIFSDEPIDFSLFEKFDAQVHFTVDRLQLPGTAGKIDLNLKIADGGASVRPMMIQMGDGYAEGRAGLRLADGGPWVSLRLSARQLPAERFFAAFSRAPFLSGKMDADIRLLGRGDSVAELMAGLEGKVYWMMGKGKIHTRYINVLGGGIASSLLRLSQKAEETDLNCLVAEMEIVRGVAKCKGLLLDTAQTTIAGKGKIDLASEKIDITMDPSPKGGVGGLSLSLGELGNPFKLGGTLADPHLTLDSAGAAITIGKALGGFTLAGPLGLVAALTDFTSAGGNPCLKSIEAFKRREAQKVKP